MIENDMISCELLTYGSVAQSIRKRRAGAPCLICNRVDYCAGVPRDPLSLGAARKWWRGSERHPASTGGCHHDRRGVTN